MTTAITVENLGKRYRIGHEVKRAGSAREAVKNAALAPFRYLKYRLSPMTEEDTLWAIRNISFEVKEGEVLGIIGANGAGKSTLLRLLSRITDPTEGRAEIRGRVNALLEVGVGFHPELTGRENIYMNAALHGLTTREIRAKLDEIVEFSGVERFLDTPVKRYSSGMLVRLGFGVAANLDPEILIVDEVLAVGDVAFQNKCLGKMQDVTSQGRTVLFVSHNMTAVQSMCHRAILLDQGRIVMTGRTEEVVREYIAKQTVAEEDAILRSDSAELLIRQVGADGESQQAVKTGDSVKWILDVAVDEPVNAPSLNMIIETLDHAPVLTLGTTYQYARPWTIAERARVIVEWPECILGSGQYNIRIHLNNGSTPVAIWRSAKRITVLDSDYFGTGKMPNPQKAGKVVTNAHWTICEESNWPGR